MKTKLSSYFVIGVGILLALFFALLIAKFGLVAILIIPLILLAIVLTYLIIRNPQLGWFLIVFFLPFERVPTYQIAGVNLKINTLLGFLTLFSWILALAFNSKKFKIQPNFLSIPLAIFTFVLVLSLTQALDFGRALSVLFFILFTIALSVLTVNMVKDRESLRQTLLVLFASSAVVVIFSLFQFGGDVLGLPPTITLIKAGYGSSIFGFPRVQAFSMEPLYLANFLLIPLGVGMALILNRAEIIKRWGLIVLVALLLIIFVLTVSRGGYLGLAGEILVLGIFLLRKIFNWRNILIGLVIVGLAGSGVYYALSQGENRALGEFLGHISLNDITKGGESIYGRLSDYQSGLAAWRENPILGLGIGNFGPWMAFYPQAAPPTGWKIVNNQYIELLAETGLVGLIAFGVLILAIIVRSLMVLKFTQDMFLKSVLIGLLAALIGVLIQYNFMSTLYIIHIWVLIGLLVAVQNIILNSKIKNQSAK